MGCHGREVIDALIAEAARTNAPEDYGSLFSALAGTETFLNLEHELAGAVSTPVFAVGSCQHAVLLFTSNDHPRLRRPFAGIVWERALEMTDRMPIADGLIVQSKGSAWVGLNKAKIRELLNSGATPVQDRRN
jgi:hypothetical protein